ncbi:hypothetical protein CFBP6411_01633 [Pseudomonas syringae group genomosp. 3]|uniref:Uncharacterized protein n=1 Tax=Pseudomonas syringae group genomosp. 3 TaxID=251701 RepID=A0A2K4WAT9_9PSED|nr:hypothetical protein [Pseudomonas syringae group genomosp. 3]SOS32993.1 hypothetical protein CFBP6411_01633 [Pseudomonas syringae group genomosp. 3]
MTIGISAIPGLPSHLQALIDQVNAEQIDYSGRDSDAEQLKGYSAKGDNALAKYIAEQMIKQQRNLHARNIEAASPD